VPQPPGSRRVTFRKLTPEEMAIVSDALGPNGDFGETLSEFMNVPVTRRDMATLSPGQWLNDEVVNIYMKLLEARDAADVSLPRCHFFTSLFYPKLAESNKGYCYANVKRWTKKVDVFTKDLIIVPIHCHGNHWTLALVNLKSKRFEYLDSMGGSPGRVLSHLRQWLQDESLAKKEVVFDLSGWNDVVYKRSTPQQANGHDCGVFMCTSADCISRDALLASFSQADMSNIRRRMVVAIMQQQLLAD